MKYIRTKYGKLYDLEELKECNVPFMIVDDYIDFNFGGRDKIIKRADTIEELCDEFIWKWNESEFPYSTARQHVRYSGYGDLKRAMREEENYGKYLNYDYEIYGAIWTDKGLIYVAKMNEKGELELL